MSLNFIVSATRSAALFVGIAIVSLQVSAEESSVTLIEGSEAVTYINVMTPVEGVTIQELAEQLTVAMESEIAGREGFLSATVHISRDNTVVTNYAQWDSEANVQSVVDALMAGDMPELARAFSMSTPVFHPYDVFSITMASD